MRKTIILVSFLLMPFLLFSTKSDSNKVPVNDGGQKLSICHTTVGISPEKSIPAQATEFIGSVFSTSNWPARWHCGNWSSFDGWFYLTSDFFIWLSYFAIPSVLLMFLYKRKKTVPFRNIFSLFIAFILLCGLTHLIDVVIFWWPAYRLSALIRFFTAAVSVGTVFALVKVLPEALQLKSPEVLENLIEERTKELKEANAKLKREIEQRQKAEDEILRLNKSLSNFRNAINSSSIVSITDKKGEILYVNENFEEISGYSKEELIGQNHRIINSGHHDKTFWVNMWKTIGRGDKWRGEVKNKRKNGTFYWVDTFILPFIDDGGIVEEYLSIRNDITPRKVAEENLMNLNEEQEETIKKKTEDLTKTNNELVRTNELMKSLQMYAEIGVWELDLKEKRTYWSEEVYKIHELPPGESVSFEYGINLFHPDFRKIISQAVDKAITCGESYDLELKIITHKKNEIWVRAIGLPVIENGEVKALRGLFQNIDRSKKIEEQLRTNQELNNLAIEAGEIGVWNLNLKTGKATWNSYMEKHLDMTEEEYSKSHSNFEKRLHPDDSTKLKEAIENSITHHAKFDIEYRFKNNRGTYHYILAKGIPTFDHEGNPNQMIGICLDLTERKQVEEELKETKERFRMALECSPIGIAIVDLNGKFLMLNKALADIVGYSEKELLKMDFQSITHPDDLEKDLAYVQKLIDGSLTTYEMEKRYVHKDNKVIWIQLNGAVVRSFRGSPLYFIAQIQDITKRKKDEIEIRNMNEALEAHSEKLEAINKELESFSYSISHDLRAPLRSIAGYAEVLKEDYSSQLDKEGNRVLRVISNNAVKMGQLIDDLLDFSRLGRKALEKNVVNMDAIVKNIINDLLPHEQETRKISITLLPLQEAKADMNMIKQAWINLISNAIKYTRNQETAKIEIGSNTSPNEIQYYVKDNGTGFNMNYSHKLFNVFQRLHSNEEFEGTGVGLAIVKRIIDKHNGKVWANAKPGKGATFYFSLPKT